MSLCQIRCSRSLAGLRKLINDFVRSLTMDKWKDTELAKMKAGGNGKAREFFESQPDFRPDWSIQEKYNSKAAALLKDKIATEADGKSWSYERSPARNFQPPLLAAGCGMTKNASTGSMGGGQQHAQIQFTDDFPDSFQNSSAGGAQNSNSRYTGFGNPAFHSKGATSAAGMTKELTSQTGTKAAELRETVGAKKTEQEEKTSNRNKSSKARLTSGKPSGPQYASTTTKSGGGSVKSLVGGGGGGLEASQMDQYKTQQKQQKKPKHPPLIITRKLHGGGPNEYTSKRYDYRTTVKSLEEMEKFCSKNLCTHNGRKPKHTNFKQHTMACKHHFKGQHCPFQLLAECHKAIIKIYAYSQHNGHFNQAFVSSQSSPQEQQANSSPEQEEKKQQSVRNPRTLPSTSEEKAQSIQVLKPLDELDLPAKYTHLNFWMDLKLDKNIRSGANIEWIKGHEEELTVEGLLSLKDGEWLNANIIDTYLCYICQKSKHAKYISTYGILSFDRKKKIPKVWYWKLQEVEIVLAPAHLNNNHWAMAVVNIPERTIHIMDSMNNGKTGQTKREFMENILAILMDVSKQQDLAPEKMGKVDDWTLEEFLKVPQQRNGIDCGIFALLFARFAVNRRSPNFDQIHIPYYRRQMCYHILNKAMQMMNSRMAAGSTCSSSASSGQNSSPSTSDTLAASMHPSVMAKSMTGSHMSMGAKLNESTDAALEKSGRIVQQSCSLAISQLSAVDSDGLSAQQKQIFEFVLSSMEKLIGLMDGHRKADAQIFESLESIKSVLDGRENPKCQCQANGFPPLLDRAHFRTQDIMEVEGLQYQLTKKDLELGKLRRAVKAKEQDISTLKLRLDMANKQVAENQIKCDSLQEELQHQKSDSDQQLADFRTQMAALEVEVELKKEQSRTGQFSTKAHIAIACIKVLDLDPSLQVLLQRLHILSSNLDVGTAIKFRYIEDALIDLSNIVIDNRYATQHPKEMGTVLTVMERLGQAFVVFRQQDINNAWERQIRLMNQLISNMLMLITSLEFNIQYMQHKRIVNHKLTTLLN